MDIDRNERAARNQSLFREVNERAVDLLQNGLLEFDEDDSLLTIMCECADAVCHEQIELTAVEYEELRRSSTRFPIKRGHEWPDVERIVAEHDRYVVVEKFGETAAIASRLDVRDRDGRSD